MYQPQVSTDHYHDAQYLDAMRWASYWHQIEGVMRMEGRSVLEVGVGNAVVADTLAKFGFDVQTLDIDPALSPDHVGSITEIPLPDAGVDTVLAAEVLEHIEWKDVPTALAEIRRVLRKAAVISVPNTGYSFTVESKFPLLPRWRWAWRLYRSWETHEFNGEHYWELGKKGYPPQRLRDALRDAGLRVVDERLWPDDPVHNYFLCVPVDRQA